MQDRYQRALNFIIPLLILLGICFILFYQSAVLLNAHKHNAYAFNALSNGWDDYLHFTVAWRGRLFSNALAAIAVRAGISLSSRFAVPLIESPMELTASLWTSGWFLAIGMVYLWAAGQRSLFHIFGLFGALSFGYLTRVTTRIYPWDMPALFIYVLITVLFVRKKYSWMLVILPFAMGFKETSLLLCLGFLFAELPWDKRIKLTLISGAVCMAVKLILDYLVQVPIPLLTMQTGYSSTITDSHFYINLLGFSALHPFLINAGTLLAFLILPNYDKNMFAFKIIAAAFIIGNLVFGVIFEYRIWFELIPFAMYGLELFSNGTSSLAGNPEQI